MSQSVDALRHLENIRDCLRDMEIGPTGNDMHYNAIKAIAAAVTWVLKEGEPMQPFATPDVVLKTST